MATEKQLEANRRNAALSTGPRSEAGKDASRRNALKHGLTAETLVVLADENPAELDERVGSWLRDLGARDSIEACTIRHAAVLSWKYDRGDRHEAAVINRMVREQAEVDHAKHIEKVNGCMDKLLPTPIEFKEAGFASEPAAELVGTIETTAEGCRGLLKCWGQIRRTIERREPWNDSAEMGLVRLSGHGPATIDDPTILDLVVAARLLKQPDEPLESDLWRSGIFSIDYHASAIIKACDRQPKTEDEARQRLLAAIDRATSRLNVVLEIREREGDQWGARESARIAMFDASNEGERLRRYQSATHREMVRTLELVGKMRLQKSKQEKEELLLTKLRNEANFEEVRQECRTHEMADTAGVSSDAEPVIRNEANSAPSVAEPTVRNEAKSAPPVGRAVHTEPIVRRNKANFDLDGVEWIDIPPFLPVS